MEESTKYCRSLHAQISLGTTSDDRFMPNGYVKAFSQMPALVMTEKIDGENNAFTKYGLFARSHTAPTISPWSKPLRDRWELIKNDLGDLEIFGEGMYGIHTLAYSKLESYYYVFGIRVKDTWLGWDEVKFYANLFDFPTVPEIEITTPLNEFYKEGDENKLLADWFVANLGMSWEKYVQTHGALGGYEFKTGKIGCEGFVVRNINSYKTNDGTISVANNEFNNLFKLVREKHVKTDKHWKDEWKPSTLISGEKHGWYGYEFNNVKK